MKKHVFWMQLVACAVMLITWGVVGLSILNGDYEAVVPGVYILMVCLIVNLVCALYRLFSDKCPHCGRLRFVNGQYCRHCGEKIR